MINFDIEEHVWGDESLEYDHLYIDSVQIIARKCNEQVDFEIYKDDAIALAKHFKLTEKDLT